MEEQQQMQMWMAEQQQIRMWMAEQQQMQVWMAATLWQMAVTTSGVKGWLPGWQSRRLGFWLATSPSSAGLAGSTVLSVAALPPLPHRPPHPFAGEHLQVHTSSHQYRLNHPARAHRNHL
jgi:hypothetical protein